MRKLFKRKEIFGKKNKIKSMAALRKRRRLLRSRARRAELVRKMALKRAKRAKKFAARRTERLSKMRKVFARARAAAALAKSKRKAFTRALEGAHKAKVLAKRKKQRAKFLKIIEKRKKRLKRSVINERAAKAVAHRKKKLTFKAKSIERKAKRKLKTLQRARIRAAARRAAAKTRVERMHKAAINFRSTMRKIRERNHKVRSSRIAVKRARAKRKRALARAAASSSKCNKLRRANANIGKLYRKLRSRMKRWARRNRWLKPRRKGRKLGDAEDDSEDADRHHYQAQTFAELLRRHYGDDIHKLLAVDE